MGGSRLATVDLAIHEVSEPRFAKRSLYPLASHPLGRGALDNTPHRPRVYLRGDAERPQRVRGKPSVPSAVRCHPVVRMTAAVAMSSYLAVALRLLA